MRWGYLDEIVEEIDSEGKIIRIAWYSDQDGEELGYKEFDLGDSVPEMWDF